MPSLSANDSASTTSTTSTSGVKPRRKHHHHHHHRHSHRHVSSLLLRFSLVVKNLKANDRFVSKIRILS